MIPALALAAMLAGTPNTCTLDDYVQKAERPAAEMSAEPFNTQWMFISGCNAGLDITVTDTVTGAQEIYHCNVAEPAQEKAPAKEFRMSFGATTPPTGFSNDVNLVNDGREVAISAPLGDYTLKVDAITSRAFSDDGSYGLFRLGGLETHGVQFTPGLRLYQTLDGDLGEYSKVAEGSLAVSFPETESGRAYKAIGVYDSTEFGIIRGATEGRYVDGRVGVKFFGDGARPDVGIGFHSKVSDKDEGSPSPNTDKGVWLDYSASGTYGIAGVYNGSVGDTPFGVLTATKYSPSDDAAFSFGAVAFGENDGFSGIDVGREVDLVVGDVAIPEMKHNPPSFLGHGPVTMELGHYKDPGKHYFHGLAGMRVLDTNLGGRGIQLSLGAGADYDVRRGSLGGAYEALLRLSDPFPGLSNLDLVWSGTPDGDTFRLMGNVAIPYK